MINEFTLSQLDSSEISLKITQAVKIASEN